LLKAADWRAASRNLVGIHLRIIARKFLSCHWKVGIQLWRLSELTWLDLRWLLKPSRHYSPAELEIKPKTISPNWKCFPGAKPHAT
jgi:hypothetical protein